MEALKRWAWRFNEIGSECMLTPVIILMCVGGNEKYITKSVYYKQATLVKMVNRLNPNLGLH